MQARAVVVPDSSPTELLASSAGFSIAVADFVEEYSKEEHRGQVGDPITHPVPKETAVGL